MVNNIYKKDKRKFIIAFDYDGVVTSRGSSGLNESLWLEREQTFLWRQVLNFVSILYNRFGSLNKEIVDTIKILKNMYPEYFEVVILIITSHTLTTSNYNVSKKSRERIKNRLIKENILVDDIIFKAGNKVDICKELGVNIMVEDNVDKIKALRDDGVNTIAKITNKNYQDLEQDHYAVEYLLDIIELVKDEMEIIKLYYSEIKEDLIKKKNYPSRENKKKLYATFNEFTNDESYDSNHPNIDNSNKLILKKSYKEYK